MQIDVSFADLAENGRYTKTIDNLLSDSTYYYRSFIYQSGLWFYGKVRSFTTKDVNVIFMTDEATSITCFSAKVSGSVNILSPYTSLIYGICYGTNVEPTINDNTTIASSNCFSLQLRKLLGGTTYYYRSYAIVDGQTRYGTEYSFRTLEDNVVETGNIDEETLTVTSRLTIGSGAYSSIILGVCYSTSETPSIYDKIVTTNEVDDENNYEVVLLLSRGGTVYFRSFVLIDGIPHYGLVKHFEAEDTTHGITGGYAWVDLGLPSGTLWATMNVGAEKAEDYGDYFAWGETTGYNEGKTTFNWTTYKYCEGSYDTMTKYLGGMAELESSDDAATANWGADWQIPNKEQLQELFNSDYTTSIWIIQNGVSGRQITSKSNGNSIFLPAAGYRKDMSLSHVGSYGHYWTRSHFKELKHDACFMYNNSGDIYKDAYGYRCHGLSVRPVRIQE